MPQKDSSPDYNSICIIVGHLFLQSRLEIDGLHSQLATLHKSLAEEQHRRVESEKALEEAKNYISQNDEK